MNRVPSAICAYPTHPCMGAALTPAGTLKNMPPNPSGIARGRAHFVWLQLRRAALYRGLQSAGARTVRRLADWKAAIGSLAPARLVRRTFVQREGTNPFRCSPNDSSRPVGNLRYEDRFMERISP